MRIQFLILMFMVCLNIATGIILELNIAGAQYLKTQSPSNSSEYQDHWNATDTMTGAKSGDILGLWSGNIFSALDSLWRMMQYLIAGFPMFLGWLGDSFIVDATARTAFNVVTGGLIALQSILMVFFVIEFISGRIITR